MPSAEGWTASVSEQKDGRVCGIEMAAFYNSGQCMDMCILSIRHKKKRSEF